MSFMNMSKKKRIELIERTVRLFLACLISGVVLTGCKSSEELAIEQICEAQGCDEETAKKLYDALQEELSANSNSETYTFEDYSKAYDNLARKKHVVSFDEFTGENLEQSSNDSEETEALSLDVGLHTFVIFSNMGIDPRYETSYSITGEGIVMTNLPYFEGYHPNLDAIAPVYDRSGRFLRVIGYYVPYINDKPVEVVGVWDNSLKRYMYYNQPGKVIEMVNENETEINRSR